MSKIFKYPIARQPGGFYTEVLLPEGATLLTVQTQNGHPMLWARVDPDEPKEFVQLYAVMTGEEFNKDARYLGTTQQSSAIGPFVLHWFADDHRAQRGTE